MIYGLMMFLKLIYIDYSVILGTVLGEREESVSLFL